MQKRAEREQTETTFTGAGEREPPMPLPKPKPAIAPLKPMGNPMRGPFRTLAKPKPMAPVAPVQKQLTQHQKTMLASAFQDTALIDKLKSVVGTTGNPGQRIADEAREASCVVMPTSGRTGAAHALIGSVAERVVRLSPVPVLVLPRPPRARRRSHER